MLYEFKSIQNRVRIVPKILKTANISGFFDVLGSCENILKTFD